MVIIFSQDSKMWKIFRREGWIMWWKVYSFRC